MHRQDCEPQNDGWVGNHHEHEDLTWKEGGLILLERIWFRIFSAKTMGNSPIESCGHGGL